MALIKDHTPSQTLPLQESTGEGGRGGGNPTFNLWVSGRLPPPLSTAPNIFFLVDDVWLSPGSW